MVKTISKRNKSSNKTLKKKEKYNKWEISSTHNVNQQILDKSAKELEGVLNSKDTPLLQRLFRENNIKKLKALPKEFSDPSLYSKIIQKEFEQMKKNKTFRPNENYYDYVNYGWIDKQTEKLKKDPKYYVEIDDFRIVQDKVYKEVLEYTDEFIKNNKSSKKANSIDAIRHCIQKADKKKGLKHGQDIREDITTFIEKEDMYGLLAYTNKDEIFSWQSPIVWSIMPDEKDVKKYVSHISPPQLGIYDYFIYIDDPADSPK